MLYVLMHPKKEDYTSVYIYRVHLIPAQILLKIFLNYVTGKFVPRNTF